MAFIKLILEANETEDEAKELLFKALELQASGESHSGSFDQASAEAVVKYMEAEHGKMWATMLDEIDAVIKADARPAK